MAFRKELNDNEVETVAGGNYAYDRTSGYICIGQPGKTVWQYKVKDGVSPDTVSSILREIGGTGYDNGQTSAEIDEAMKTAIGDYVDFVKTNGL